MDEKEILQKQVDALEKLLQIKEAIIQEQEAKINRLEMAEVMRTTPQMPSIPSIWFPPQDLCSDGLMHEYDPLWYSTAPQPCRKCGKTIPHSQPSWTVSSSADSVSFTEAVHALDSEERALGTITDIANKKNV